VNRVTISKYFDAILDELGTTLTGVSDERSEELIRHILISNNIFLAGAGRSGLAVKGFTMRLMHMGLPAYVVGGETTPAITADDLLIIGSGSGSTGSLLEIAKKAQALGAKLALVTTSQGSPISQLADVVLVIPAPTPKVNADVVFKSHQPLGTLFEQCLQLTFDAMVLRLMDILEIDAGSMFERHANLE
jgi:6-phospho-3-hexuloisomerase